MASRPSVQRNYGHTMSFKVAAGQTVTKDQFVKFASADNEVQNDGGDAVDVIIGVALQTKTEGKHVDVLLPGPVVAIKSSGTVTRGAKVKSSAGGKVVNATAHNSDGTGNESTYGQAMNSGVNDDLVGVCLSFANRGV